MSDSFDHDQARRFIWPDVGPNCLPRLSADDSGRQRVNIPMFFQSAQSLLAEFLKVTMDFSPPIFKIVGFYTSMLYLTP